MGKYASQLPGNRDLGLASHMNTSLICCLEKVISETELVWLTGLMRKGPDSAVAAL